MRVHLARIGGGHVGDLSVDDFEHVAAADRFREHELTPDPAAADVILFTQCHRVDWGLRAIREHALARKHWEKILVFDERDRPWRSFPGVYVGAPARWFDPQSQRAWAYPGTPEVTSVVEPDLLFSFVGSPTAPCRARLFELEHADAIVEQVLDFMFWDAASPDYDGRKARYFDVLARSRFVLCPRGRGTSSFRLYETLAAGRVPVIISDEWVAPPGPDWEACSLRWPEGRTDGLIEMLEERDRDWQAMSAAAASTYGEYFATEVCFHRVVDLCSELLESGCQPSPEWRVQGRYVAAAIRERTQRWR